MTEPPSLAPGTPTVAATPASAHLSANRLSTLPSWLLAAAASPAGVDFVGIDERVEHHSYAMLYEGAKACAGSLAARGIGAGERVAIVLPTGPAFYHALFGTLLVRAIAVPLYPPVRLGKMADYDERLRTLLALSQARLVVTDAALTPLLAPVLREAKVPLEVVVLGAEGAQPLSAPAGLSAAAEAASLDDIALLQSTSGTTNRPKLVALTHRQVASNVAAIIEQIYAEVPLPAGVRKHSAVSWLPLYHDMGLMGCVLGAVYDAAALTLLGPETFVARPSLWLRAIARARATVSAAPNFAYALCAERIDEKAVAGIDLSCWALAFNGAELASASTMQAFAERFAAHGFRPEALTPVYGLAEATLAITFQAPSEPFRTLAPSPEHAFATAPMVGVGRPLPGYSLRLLDDQQKPVRWGHVGHIYVRGPSVMEGYWRDGAAHSATDADGWLGTGDLGIESNGELYIVGRSKDVLIVNGRNLSPESVEMAANAVDGVRRGCVVAVGIQQGQQGTEQVVLLAETRLRSKADRAALERRLLRAVAGHMGLRLGAVALLAPGTLPRTSSGKLRRAEARRQYLAHALVAPDSFVATRLLWRMLRERLAAGFSSQSPPS